ncbi:MAG TPA: DUF504 domain-containing protein [Hadesarchaea archaeon]|nr:DUF504 domain-containing protein [Hadesarchaea archaeon]
MGPREVLNKLKWGGANTLQSVKVTILHRGAPNDRRVIEGTKIIELGSGFMHVVAPEGEVEIPYHRILQIEVRGETLWRKTSIK